VSIPEQDKEVKAPVILNAEQLAQLDWEKTDNMMPAIVQHAVSGEVLMMGYMNP
jgi:phosphoribosyl-ATP pyrophosphohydrolase/phosphoribosyl-AMP cyclohydrolase